MTHLQKVIILSISLGTLVGGLNTSIVNTVLPEIQESLQLPLSSIQWIVTIYPLILVGFILPFGRLGDLIGHRKVYLLGLMVFSIFSISAGLTQSLFIILLSRIFQAIGGALMMAASPAILTAAFPNEQRGKVLGLNATIVYVGISLGPILGGWLTTWVGWSSIFYFNILFTIPAMYFAFRFLPQTEKKNQVQFDFIGGILFLSSVTLLLLALNQGSVAGWTLLWLAVLFFSFLLGALFVWVESKAPAPMLKLSLLRNRVISFAVLSCVIHYILMFFNFTLLPIYLAQVANFPPSHIGSIFAITPFMMLVCASFSGYISDRIGTRIPTTVGMGVLTLGLLSLALTQSEVSLNWIVISCVLIGIGSGLFTSPNNSAMFGEAPPTMRGVVSGLNGTSRYLGHATGMTLSTILFVLFQKFHIPLHINPMIFAFQLTMLVGAGLGLAGIATSFLAVPKKQVKSSVTSVPYTNH